ncbi:hypothetical protein CPLU01_08615 [Colletotrichum plurivorum]|uniref:Uncharacterized protein n=1 Tax=Colletotrichum plurivorum TaxID=2175906 RepID=A0A8H6NC96_9PEZI|nr:hypothetical protein CPLU01_08615 [Colletotrichum plurivorum]
MTIEDEQELANLMLLAAATYSYPPQQNQNHNSCQPQDADTSHQSTQVPAPLPLKNQLSPTPSNSLLSPRQATGNDQTRRTSVQESPVDSDLLSPGGISLDDTVYLRAGEGHEEVFELALCIEDGRRGQLE